MGVLHLNCLREEVIVGFGCGVGRYIRNWVLTCKTTNIDDASPPLSFEHAWDQPPAHHSHHYNIDFNLLEDAFLRYFMQNTNIRDADIVYEQCDIHSFQFSTDPIKEVVLPALREVSHNCLSLQIHVMIFLFYPLKHVLHLLFVPCNNTYIESQFGELLAKSQPYPITATSDHCP